MDPFLELTKCFHDAPVRYVVIGVWGANYYARAAGQIFTTLDRDILLPLDPSNLLQAWACCDQIGLALRVGSEPLDVPRDELLANRVTEARAVTTAASERVQVDLTLTMAGFAFDDVYSRRRMFTVSDVDIPVARLADIVESKRTAGRLKDQLFLATHEEALRSLLGDS